MKELGNFVYLPYTKGKRRRFYCRRFYGFILIYSPMGLQTQNSITQKKNPPVNYYIILFRWTLNIFVQRAHDWNVVLKFTHNFWFLKSKWQKLENAKHPHSYFKFNGALNHMDGTLNTCSFVLNINKCFTKFSIQNLLSSLLVA